MATHLTASMRIVPLHLRMKFVGVDTARDTVLAAAARVKAGSAPPEIERLVARLEKATGCGIFELARLAEGWLRSS